MVVSLLFPGTCTVKVNEAPDNGDIYFIKGAMHRPHTASTSLGNFIFNSIFPKAFAQKVPKLTTAPISYKVAVKSATISSTTDPGLPYTFFDTGDINDPKVYDLITGVKQKIDFNGNYPESGIYNHLKVIAAYLELTLDPKDINTKPNVGLPAGARTFRLITSDLSSSQGLIGDVLVRDPADGQFKFIKYPHISLTDTRSALTFNLGLAFGCQQKEYCSIQGSKPNRELTQYISLEKPVTIPPLEAGEKAKVVIDFDVSGTFQWVDIDSNGVWDAFPVEETLEPGGGVDGDICSECAVCVIRPPSPEAFEFIKL